MIKLTLPTYLVDMLPDSERVDRPARRSILLDVSSWIELVRELQGRFPRLAQRVLTESGSVATGFLLIVNDEIQPNNSVPLTFQEGDEICVIAAIAGG